MRKAGHDVDFEPGRDFHPGTKLPQDGYVYIEVLSISGPHAERMRGFRASWILRRSIRPCVTAPTQTPLPHKSQSTEQRARKQVVGKDELDDKFQGICSRRCPLHSASTNPIAETSGSKLGGCKAFVRASLPRIVEKCPPVVVTLLTSQSPFLALLLGCPSGAQALTGTILERF